MNFAIRLPLRTTIPMTAVAIAAVASCFSTPVSVEIGRAAAYESAHGDSRLFVRQAAALLGTAGNDGRIERLSGLLSSFRENVSVTAVYVFGPDDQVVDAWGTNPGPSSWSEVTASWPAGVAAELRAKALSTDAVQSFVDKTGHRILVMQAIRVTGSPSVGTNPHLIVMDYSVQKGLDEVFVASVVALGIFFVLVSSLAIAAGWTLRWLLRRRSEVLLRVARDIAHGNFDARVGSSVDDEFGAIATAIDDMAARLAETRDRNRQSEERYRILFEEAEDAVVLCDDHGTVEDANHAAGALFGRPLEELRGMKLDTLLTLEQGASISQQLSAGHDAALRADALNVDGGRVPVECHGRTLLGLGRLALFRDLRRELEAARMRDALVVQERLAALGRLAAGVGHELNNPLSYVLGNLELIAAELEKSPASTAPESGIDLTSLVRDARDGAARMKRIVGELHVFTRGAGSSMAVPFDASSIDVKQEMEVALQMAARTIEGRARLEKHILPALPAVRCEEGRLAQVVVNLLANAAQAMPPERTTTENIIGMRALTDDDGKTVVIEVADNGTGIDPDVLPHLFAPFFTTRAGDGGSGLGLSVSRELVLSMGGSIDVQSVPGGGSLFRVRLPALPAGTAQALTPARVSVDRDTTAPGDEIAGARVLIVDDDPLVARVLGLMLKDADVTVAATVVDAIAAARRAEFDCILCDLVMPGGGGEAVVRALRTDDDRVLERVVFMTAGIPSQELNAFVGGLRRPVLEKPIKATALRGVVADQVRRQQQHAHAHPGP
jgi:PAS domain S-box-containing protein